MRFNTKHHDQVSTNVLPDSEAVLELGLDQEAHTHNGGRPDLDVDPDSCNYLRTQHSSAELSDLP